LILGYFPLLRLVGMIEFIVIFNRQGKIRASKWYKPAEDAERLHLIAEINRIIAIRDSNRYANFLDFKQRILVYRRYASLYFAMLIDPQGNQLAALTAIHLLVETLDRYFHNVCELDLVFNFWKVIQLMDEMFLAGELVESSKQVILERMYLLDKNNKGDGNSGTPKERKKDGGGAKDAKVKKTPSVKPKDEKGSTWPR